MLTITPRLVTELRAVLNDEMARFLDDAVRQEIITAEQAAKLLALHDGQEHE